MDPELIENLKQRLDRLQAAVDRVLEVLEEQTPRKKVRGTTSADAGPPRRQTPATMPETVEGSEACE